MHTERVTVSMPAEQAASMRAVVAAGGADSVSAYVAGAVRDRLARDRALAALDDLWGPLPETALTWARARLSEDAADRSS